MLRSPLGANEKGEPAHWPPPPFMVLMGGRPYDQNCNEALIWKPRPIS